MDYQFLTLKNCYLGIFFNVVESLFGRSTTTLSIPAEYRLIRWIKRQGGDHIASVGIFEDREGVHVIIKHLGYRWKTLTYRSIMNEVSLLTRLRGWAYTSRRGRQITLPALREVRNLPGELIVVKEFEEGKTLDTVSPAEQRSVTEDCLEALQTLDRTIAQSIGKRSAWQLGSSFPFYWLRALMKDPLRAPLFTRLLFSFYRHWPSTLGGGYVVTHRDLYAKNVLVDGSAVVILDLESMVSCNQETDLALTTRFNLKAWGKDMIQDFASNATPSRAAKQSLSTLSIYYAIQMMVTDRVNGMYYREALDYLSLFENQLATLI